MGGFGTPSPEGENGFVGGRLCFVGARGTKQRLLCPLGIPLGVAETGPWQRVPAFYSSWAGGSLPPFPGGARFSGMGVDQWLDNLGFAQYARAFVENDIDFGVLAGLTDADLKELGVGSLGHRKRLLAAIQQLQSASPQGALQTPASATGERRQVTILFADLCGFTSLSRSLDPEEIREVVARFTARVDGIVAGYGGTIDKHIGDAVMALFGAPRAHDDDPLRAARAALDIHAALARMNDASRQTMQAHIGIASGDVVAGTLSRGETHDYTVLGDSVNLAARLR